MRIREGRMARAARAGARRLPLTGQRGPTLMRYGQVGRLAVPAALRLAQRVRSDPRRRQGVALDRGLRLADKRSFPADRAAWLKARDAVCEEVMARGWSAVRGSFVQSYGSEALDASALLMPLTFFMAANDPRMLATVDATRSAATRGGLAADGLVYRYDPRAAPD